ncbi:hypothetical protein [Cellulomonas marina]|uniref:Uncharacterized protein n=1 Tax=Cellulomonas marina TaxID=988821 RepID=A0A1I0ZZP7_9CELL|nr:hypothetical protein [Cellulomonas marina]SFB29778.1 hypothetical protein SAMN05421867_11333 [Cellulomonas marina]
MNEADDSEWTVVHPCELVATFLVPLPDPIPLPDSSILPTYRRLEQAAIRILEPWLDELWLQRADQSAIMMCRDAFAADDAENGPVNWSNKYALVTSIQFHQTFSDAGLRLGLEPAMRLAHVVAGPRLTTEEKRNALDQFDVEGSAGAPGLRDIGLGAVTVAECRVGLRIIGELPDLESPLTRGTGGDAPFGPLESDRIFPDEISMWQWRKFPEGMAPDSELVERRLRAALDIALTELRTIQRAAQAVRRSPTVIASLERLPLVVPVVIRFAGGIGRPDGGAHTVLLATHPNTEHLHVPEPFTDDEMQTVNDARHRIDDGPFAAHLDVHREAHVALTRLGDYRLAALLLGISAESLIDELILHLMWEEGQLPEYVARDWLEGLDARARAFLPARLLRPWDVKARNPIGVWAQDVAALRHRVAHAAYRPNLDESRQSFFGVNELVAFFCDRLASPEILKKYPRTALALAGETGLRKRNAYTNRVRNLQNDASEVAWTETFQRWRESWRRTRRDQTARVRVPDDRGAWLIAVRHPDGLLLWVRHDRSQHLAIEVDVETGDLPAGFVDRLHGIADVAHHSHGYTLPVSIAVEHRARTSPRPKAIWVEDYHHVPLTGVMVDGSDHRHPVDIGIAPTLS